MAVIALPFGGADMRNCMLAAVALFFALWWLCQPLGNHGLWLAMNGLMLTRGLLMARVGWRRGF